MNSEETMRELYKKIAEEHKRLKQIKKIYKCPLCGQTIEGRAYPIDDLECRIDTHLVEKHGFMGEDTD